MPVPQFLQSVLWSYDLSQIDSEKSKNLIITQALNYGDQKTINWILNTYSPEEIKEVVTNPNRGIWFWDKLRFWLAKFDLMIDPLMFDVAIRHLEPRVRIYQEFFKRKGLM